MIDFFEDKEKLSELYLYLVDWGPQPRKQICQDLEITMEKLSSIIDLDSSFYNQLWIDKQNCGACIGLVK
jgi:hypothetical protein